MPDRLRRFEQEARATSALNHPNILTVYDIGTASTELGGAPFIVMELLEGEELRAQLDGGAMQPRQAIEYAQQIAAGLSAAHEKGIIHRDLKPENLFVTTDGRVKILDFGLAKLRPLRKADFGMQNEEAATLIQGEANPPSPIRHPQLTAPGTVMGTVAYMSPEQVRGQDLDHRSDIFSFGLILYEMLAGRRAFDRQSFAETMAAIANEEAPELSELNPKVTPQLEKIVRRCLEKKPERRFQSASDLGFALEALSSAGYARAPACWRGAGRNEGERKSLRPQCVDGRNLHARARAFPACRRSRSC
jgi:serine/threonine protein kinase